MLMVLMALIAGMLGATFAVSASAATVRTVTNETELRDAISASANGDTISIVENIRVTSEVVVNKSITISGNGLTVSVPSTGVTDAGANATSPSTFRVFRVPSGTVTFQNMTVKGGNIQGAGFSIAGSATVHLRGVVVSNSRNSGGGGGGIHNLGTLYLEESSIIRNSATYGGGFLNGGTMYVNGSSLSENRSESTSGGGGAAENASSGTLNINNSTLSNNQSTEIGGAINNVRGKINVLNSSFTGNVAYGSYNGGAIGNNGGSVTIANSAFAYNYRLTSGNVFNPKAYALDDFGTTGQYITGAGVSISYSTYQAAMPSGASAGLGNRQYVETNATPGTTGTNGATPNVPAYFAGGMAAAINNPLTGDPLGVAMYRPFLVRGSGAYSGVASPALAVSGWGNLEPNRGTTTRFSTTLVSGQPVMSYYNRLAGSPGWVALRTASPATAVGVDADRVTRDQVGTARPNGIPGGAYTTAGSAQVEVSDVFQVQSVTAAGGSVTGASIYGDVYPAGTSVTVVAVPNAGQKFSNWIINGTPCDPAVCPRTYVFTVTENVQIKPVFVAGTSPVISSIAPAGGPVAGGTTITINGTGFTGNVSVTVGGNTCTNVVVVSSTQVTCETPAGTAGAAAVEISSSGGTDTIPSGFAYVDAPTITGIAPNGGPASGGTIVTIEGTGFVPGTTVAIGTNACTAVKVTSLTTLTCVAPAGSGGPEDVVVTTPGGTVTETDGFAYVGPPTVSAIAPAVGSISGGTTITVDGSEFVDGTTVTIGGNACAPVTIVSGTQLTCVTPPGTQGAADLVVTTPSGSTTDAGGFTYLGAPTVASVAPAGGDVAGGTAITITGTDFDASSTVTVGGNACVSVVVVSPTEITCTTPAGTAGLAAIEVTTSEGTASVPDSFTYATAPTIADVLPAGGDVAGGTTITVTGTGFFTGATVTVGGTACTPVVVVSPTELTCVTPAGSHGLADVEVTTPLGTATDVGGFAYVYAPTLTSVSPAGGDTAGGTEITIVGTNLYDGATVTVGGAACTNVVVTPLTSLTCTTPPGTAGLADIEIVTTEGSVTAPDAFTFAEPPTITNVVPGGTPVGGGKTITIEGTGFFGDTTVEIGGAACTDVVIVSPTQLTCTTPEGTLGAADVEVTTPIGSDTVSDQFAYIADPTITAVGPAGGPLAGGTTLTVTGSGFVEGMEIEVGGQPCTSVTVTSPTTATCVTPAGSAGLADVLVLSPAGEATAAGAFTYAAAPVVENATPAGGSPTGGTPITVVGDGFYDGVAVTVGGSACTDVVVLSPTELTCVTPSGTAGLADIEVTTPEGTDTATGGFTYAEAPTITAVSPTQGSSEGGNTVTIDGTGFFPGATVTIGGQPCTNVTIVSPSQLTCVSSAGAPGASDIVVTTSEGSATDSGGFTYVAAPTIGSVGPAGGAPAGGTAITIVGSNFLGGATVTIGGTACVNVVVVSSTEITCTTPAGTAGTAAVVVDVPGGGGSVTDADGFTYANAPEVDVVTPQFVPATGGSEITVQGDGFFNGATVTVGGQPCTNVVVIPSERLTCTAPPGTSGPADVVVTTSEGSQTKTGAVTYVGVPTITNIGPAGGPPEGGTMITIEGDGFAPGTTVTVGGEECTSLSLVSLTELTCYTPAQPGGALADVVVTAPGGTADDPSGFTFADAPTVDAALPGGGPLAGGNTVTIGGSGFFDGIAVTIGGNVCTNVVVLSPIALTCTAPSGSAGAAVIEVTTTEGTASLPDAYLYAPAPTVDAVSPTGQPITGGSAITIDGTGFYPGMTVLIGGLPCTNVTVVSPTQLTCSAPAGLSGAVSLTLSSPSGEVTVMDAFYYTPLPPETLQCPLTISSPRPAKQKLPVGKKVTLIKRSTTAPECTVQVRRKVSRSATTRGDLASKVRVKVNERTGKVTAIATVPGVKVKLWVQATPDTLPYNLQSSAWKRAWTSR